MTNREEILIKVDNEVIEYVKNYTYLGQLISFRDRTGIEIESSGLCLEKILAP